MRAAGQQRAENARPITGRLHGDIARIGHPRAVVLQGVDERFLLQPDQEQREACGQKNADHGQSLTDARFVRNPPDGRSHQFNYSL